jgi:predicted MFS family arabinose efflux permease
MAKDLALTNTRAALINSVLSVMWALGAYLIARWSDARGSRKPFLPAFLVIFSACAPSCPVWRRRSGFCCLHVGSWA